MTSSAEKNRQLKALRDQWKAEGRCYYCGGLPLVTGRLCARHAAMNRESTRKSQHNRRKRGTCMLCGDPRLETKTLCARHAAAIREGRRRQRAREKQARRARGKQP